MVELLEQRALLQADQRVYTFLEREDGPEVHFTYSEIHEAAKRIAAHLQSEVAPGERVLLLYPPGLQFIAALFGCFCAGVIAVPACPPRPNRPSSRLQALLADCRPAVALTTRAVRDATCSAFSQSPALHRLRWMCTDSISDFPQSSDWQRLRFDPDSASLLQYTSGSTSEPKGVMLSQSSILENSAIIQSNFGLSGESVGVIWLPPHHDMGLIGGILQPLYAGFPVVLLSPMRFLQRPVRWLQAISSWRATCSGGPNFAYELCARKISLEDRQALDLSTWTVAFTGAEPIRKSTLDDFLVAFAGCGFRKESFHPCYGLAESTLMVSRDSFGNQPTFATLRRDALEAHRVAIGREDDSDCQTLVSCGRPCEGIEVTVVNPQTCQPCAADAVGEIWVSGPSVALGYWGRREETQQVFSAYLPGGAGPFLRTGDLGFLYQGKLYITGRIKDLIIINGQNYYPQDIELTAERSHDLLRGRANAAFSANDNSGERLVLVQEVGPRFDSSCVGEVVQAIRLAVLQNHDLRLDAVHLSPLGTVPKTTSGKIRRSHCRAAYMAGDLECLR
ncbi:MAG: fatty acyl-AMP ligase [Terriglobales bacterium]